MSRLVLLALAVGLTVALLQAQPPMDTDPSWAKSLLAEAKLTPATAQLTAGRWLEGGPMQLTTFRRLWDDWRQIDPTMLAAAKDFLAADTLEKLLVRAAPLIDIKPLPASPPKEKPAKEPPADEQLVRAIVALAKEPPADKLKELRTRAATVPPVVARSVAVILEAVPGAIRLRDQALAKFGKPETFPTAFTAARGLATGYASTDDSRKLMSTVDLTALMHGGQQLSRAVDQALAMLASVPNQKFDFTWDTPLGTIALSGSQDNSYGAGPYLLILDTGGNDKYAGGGATADASHPVSVIIDVAGNDRYEAKSGPAFGTGILGYGILVDLVGDDIYESKSLAFGCSSFGVGLLVDRAGKDRYQIDRVGQGAAWFGIGILADRAGDDEYHCYQLAQGFAGVRGCGLLLDHKGDDLYDANNKDIRYPSAQDPKHNVSLAQGCGFGRRAHPGDGHSLAGGVGILIDGDGKDRYRAGLFAQGIGYWYGLGMLVDLAGNDSYEGVWYNLGSAAHYAVGALYDGGGDDRYFASLHVSIGAAHDFSIGWLHDVAGNDSYECPGSSMGSSIYNSVGVLWDQGGTNVYKSTGAAFGQTGVTRPEFLTLGLFIDEGGKPDFPKGTPARPKSKWLQPAKPGEPLSHGLGMSR